MAFADGEAFSGDSLKTGITDAGRDCGFDAGGEEFLEQLEELVLERDRQGENAVQECGDRRQFIEQSPFAGDKAKPGGILESAETGEGNLSPVNAAIEFKQDRAS